MIKFKKFLIYLLFIIIGIYLYYIINNYNIKNKSKCNILVSYNNIEKFNIGAEYNPDNLDSWNAYTLGEGYNPEDYKHNPFEVTTLKNISTDLYSQEHQENDGLATIQSPKVIYAVRSTNGLYLGERIRTVWQGSQENAVIKDNVYGYSVDNIPTGQLSTTFNDLSNTTITSFGLVIPPMISPTDNSDETYGWLPLDGHYIATCFENSNDMTDANAIWDTTGGGNLNNQPGEGGRKSPFHFLTNSGTVVNRGPNYGSRYSGVAGRRNEMGNNMRNIFWVAGSIKVEDENWATNPDNQPIQTDVRFRGRVYNKYNALSFQELKDEMLKIMTNKGIDNISGYDRDRITDETDKIALLQAITTYEIDLYNVAVSGWLGTDKLPNKRYRNRNKNRSVSVYYYSTLTSLQSVGRVGKVLHEYDVSGVTTGADGQKVFDPKLPKEYPLTTCEDMYTLDLISRPDIYTLMKATRVLLDPNRCYAYLMIKKYEPLSREFKTIRHSPNNPTPFAYTQIPADERLPEFTRLVWNPKRELQITQEWVTTDMVRSVQEMYLTGDNGYSVEELANYMIETNKKILYTFGTSLMNYLFHHPDRVNNPPIDIVISPNSESSLIKLQRIRIDLQLNNDLTDSQAVDEAIRKLGLDTTGNLLQKIDTIYDILNLPRHGLGIGLAVNQWVSMAQIKETSQFEADSHRNRVRSEIQNCLDQIDDITGVNVVYKHLANMNDRDDDLGIYEGNRLPIYTGVIEILTNPFNDAAEQERINEQSDTQTHTGTESGGGRTNMRQYYILYQSSKTMIERYMPEGIDTRANIDIRHPIHIQNNQKYGHIGYIINTGEYNANIPYTREDTDAVDDSDITNDNIRLDRTNLSSGAKVYVYGRHLETDNVWVYVANDTNNPSSNGKIVLIDINNIGYKGVRDGHNSRFPRYLLTAQDCTDYTDINQCAAWLVGCNPFNVALQYPIEGGGQINTLRWERRIQPRALGLLTSLDIQQSPVIYQPFRKVEREDGNVQYDLSQPFITNKDDFGQLLNTHGRLTDGQQRRIGILLDTLSRFELSARTLNYHGLAKKNLEEWSGGERPQRASFRSAYTDLRDFIGFEIHIVSGDWGELTLRLTKEYGKIFAVLNMANAYHPGGGYQNGRSAQEENMFRRTDCHFYIDRSQQLVLTGDKYVYNQRFTNLINGEGGSVYLDTDYPRVCICGRELYSSEAEGQEGMGYELLNDDDIFMFYEMRSAAADLGNHSNGNISTASRYDIEQTKVQTRVQNMSRITAQIETLKRKNVRHVVLSAFGCGAFFNDPTTIAQIYVEVISQNIEHFDVIAFAIYSSRPEEDNYTPFLNTFRESELLTYIIEPIIGTECATSTTG